MPSYRVTEPTVSLSRFDVIGQDGDEPGYVGHVGLAEVAGPSSSVAVPVCEMGPPLRGSNASGQMQCNVLGSATLTNSEIQKIKAFIDRHANEHESFLQVSRSQLIQAVPEIYCIIPHASPLRETDGRYTRTRFSCAGFVLEAYKKARMTLIDVNNLPSVDMAVIASAYPLQVRLIENGRVSREALGLDGEGPWPVLLCGYLFHSLDRRAADVRQRAYSPDSMDRVFPK